MTSKRPTLRGKAIFLDHSDDSMTAQQHDSAMSQHNDVTVSGLENTVNDGKIQTIIKETYYLPLDLVNKINNLWYAERQSKRGIKKSYIVSDLLNEAIKARQNK